MYDIILINSKSVDEYLKVRGIGPHLIANRSREMGLSALVIDFIESWNKQDFIKAINKFIGPNTKLFGFSMTWAKHPHKTNVYPDDLIGDYLTNNNFEYMIDEVKKINPQIKIVCGGKKTLEFYYKLKHNVDYFFDGYSECQFMDFLENKKIFDKVINYDTESNSRSDYDFKHAKNLLPKETFLTPRETLGIELSRGCRFNCKFCSFPLIGRKDASSYLKDSDVLRQELIYNYETFGIQKYSIQDDTFNDSIEKVKYFYDVVKSLPFKIYFWCYLRAEVIVKHPEMIDMLLEMGLTETWFGIETFCHKAGKNIGKGMDPDLIKNMLYNCKKSWRDQVTIQMGYIVGLPDEIQEELYKHSEWFMQPNCPVDRAVYSPLYIRPKVLIDFFQSKEISEFDRNYEKYGFYFPEEANFTGSEDDFANLNRFYNWQRDTNDDIPNLFDAYKISLDLNEKMKEFANKKSLKHKTGTIHSSNDDFGFGMSNDEIRECYGEHFKNYMHKNPRTFSDIINESYIQKLLRI